MSKDFKTFLRESISEQFASNAAAFRTNPSAKNWTILEKWMWIHQAINPGGCIGEKELDAIIETTPIAKIYDVIFEKIDPENAEVIQERIKNS